VTGPWSGDGGTERCKAQGVCHSGAHSNRRSRCRLVCDQEAVEAEKRTSHDAGLFESGIRARACSPTAAIDRLLGDQVG